MKEYLEKYYDMFNLYNRIKLIDENYELLFNKKDKCFEIHNFNQMGASLVFKTDILDSRIILKLKETRRENMLSFFKKLDEENEKLEASKQKSLINDAQDKLSEIAKYSFNLNRDLTQKEITNILNI
ncbi:MAG: hypothetical protein IJT25_01670 [Clostridia bacterium]|nr:hypothetical protein [Clostridia bacterium]